MWKPACQTLSKALDILSARAWVTLNLFKALEIPSDTAVKRSEVDREDLKPYWKSEKSATLLYVINKSIIYKLFKDFTNHRKKTNRAVVFSHTLFNHLLAPTVLNTGTTNETFQQSWKQDSSRDILKFSQCVSKFRFIVTQNYH